MYLYNIQLKYIVVKAAVVLMSVIVAAKECDSGIFVTPVTDVETLLLRQVFEVRSVADDVDIEFTKNVSSLLNGLRDLKLLLFSITFVLRRV